VWEIRRQEVELGAEAFGRTPVDIAASSSANLYRSAPLAQEELLNIFFDTTAMTEGSRNTGSPFAKVLD
jgi:hypothetical protein